MTSATLPAAGATRVYPLGDTITLLRRNIRNQLRDLVAVFAIIGIPVLFLLLFVYVFGGALDSSVAGRGAAHYVDYILPGMIVMTAAAGLIGVATHTAVDMSEGFITRLRTMPVFRPAILLARVLSFVIQTVLSMVVVLGVALLMGLSPNASALEWLVLALFLTLVAFCLTWLGLAFGLAAKSAATASNGPFPLVLLPLVGSGVVPTATMSTGVRYFAKYQPFTPIIETVRGLMQGTAIGNNAVIALAWCLGIGLLGFLWSIKAFGRERPVAGS